MRCEQVIRYLPGYAGGDLRRDMERLVGQHVASCSSCRAETARLERITTGLASLSEREIEPPALLIDSILEATEGRKGRRLMPPLVPPAFAPELVRLVQDNREAIASIGATAAVAAGTAYAVWRALKRRPTGQAATS